LLLQGFLRLVEQAHILNGNDGLIGEGLQECDLAVGEWFKARQTHGTDGHAVPKHRYEDEASIPHRHGKRAGLWEAIFCREVGNMTDAAIKNGASVRVVAVEAVRVSSPSELEPLGRDTHGGDKTNGISQETDDGCSEGSTQSGAALGNRVEHRLGI